MLPEQFEYLRLRPATGPIGSRYVIALQPDGQVLLTRDGSSGVTLPREDINASINNKTFEIMWPCDSKGRRLVPVDSEALHALALAMCEARTSHAEQAAKLVELEKAVTEARALVERLAAAEKKAQADFLEASGAEL